MAIALLVVGSTLTFWIPPFASTSSYLSVVNALGCSCNCRRLAYGAFQLTHMSRDDHTPRCSIDQAMAAKTKTKRYYSAHNIATRVNSACKHQCTTAITTMRTEFSCAFPESYTADDSWIVRSSDGGHGGQKGS